MGSDHAWANHLNVIVIEGRRADLENISRLHCLECCLDLRDRPSRIAFRRARWGYGTRRRQLFANRVAEEILADRIGLRLDERGLAAPAPLRSGGGVSVARRRTW